MQVGGGRFEVRGLAGEGGMSLVYRGVDREDGDAAVAIKILRDGVSVGERFARESRLLADLEDPGIVRYVSHGTTDGGQHFLVTEWLEGQPLAHRLEARSLALEDTLQLGRRVAEILGRLHARGIVHRDIKPSNLFLRGGAIERVTLIDFGIARYSAGAGELTRTGTAVGTPGYMAPEQARGERDIDARADVFALGCVLFRCMTGRTPFRGDDALAVQLKIMLEDAPSMRELRPGLPSAFDQLVARMLARARDERPPHGAAVARELARVPLGSVAAASEGAREAEGLTAAEQQLMSVVRLRFGGEGRTLVDAETGRRSAALAELARRHGAQLDDPAEGDVVFVIAGTGVASDQATRAARCALALVRDRPDATIAVTTGTGTVLAVPRGEAIDRAGELVRSGAGAGIHLDEVTAGLLPPQFETAAAGGGIRLLREREQSEPIRTLLGRPTPFVGRRKELRILDAILDECLAERVPRGALLVGPAGIGKSRVRYEFMRALERDRAGTTQVWLGRGDPLLAASPFGVVAQALRRQCGVRQGDPPEARRAALRARVARTVAPGRVDLTTAFLGEMIGAPFSDQSSPPLRAARESARVMHDRISQSWAELVAAECQARPIVLVIEDVHWADMSSLQLIEEALGLGDRPFFLLGVTRPEVDDVFPRLWAGRDLQRVVLSPLTRAASAELVRDALGPEVAGEVLERVCERSAGNAFFLEELIRAEAERAAGDAPSPAPGTVLAVVQARLESLELDARRVLRAASVLGQAFWRGAVDVLIGGDETIDVDRQLSALAAGELIVRAGETRIQGQVQYAFRHFLVREAVYATLTDDDRIRGHRLAADWLERIGDAEADAAVVAEHHEKGGAPERAARWWKAAGEKAMAGADPDAAIGFTGRAIACGAAGELLGEAQLVRAAAFDWKGEIEPGLRAAAEAVAALPAGGRLWCRAIVLQARLVLHGGDSDGLRALARQLHALASSGPITVELAAASVLVVYLLRMSAALGEDDLLLDVIETRSPPAVLTDPAIRGYLTLCRVVLIQANIPADLAARREAAGYFEEAGDTIRAHFELFNCYHDLFHLGAFEEALRGFESLRDWAMRRNILSLALTSQGFIAECRFYLGDKRGGVEAVREVLEEHRRRKSPRQEGGVGFSLARMHLEIGELEQALAIATRAVEVLAVSDRYLYPVALAVLAMVELAHGRPADALAHAREAMSEPSASLESGEMLIHQALVESRIAVGEPDAARAAVRVARSRIEELAGQIQEPGLRRSFLALEENERLLALADELESSP